MVAFKPIDLVLTYFFDELRPIAGNVSAQVVIANGAGAIHVPEVVSDVHDKIISLLAERDQLKAENEALRLEKSEPCDGCFMADAEALSKDAARLNWLDGRSRPVVEGQCMASPEGELTGYDWGVFGQCSTVREAIDYAMSAEEKP